MKRWVLLGAAVLVAATGIFLWQQDEATPAPPSLTQVKRGDVTASVAALGKVEPIATRELSFGSTGTVTSVLVKPGDVVTAGQTLATIDATTAQEQLEQAKDSLAAAKDKLASATDQSKYSVEVAVNNAERSLSRAEKALSGTQISAPIAGKILKVAGEPGDQTPQGAFIILGAVETMLVKAEFSEADAVTLATGQQATVQLAGKPGDVPVTISQVAAAGTVTGKLVKYTVLLSFASPPADLLLGQSATATVVLKRSANVLYLPQSAVRVTGDETGVVKTRDGMERPVGVGLRGDGNVEITGLAEGTEVLSVFRA
ncbi:efflux RND transporter periplasmic adaptor subunit [Catelliglobosispora koreensis]|uniref:efflux RND transporter periplasmic adaptor subunit n=1 Tax=Catelliglobosispora koreensis TaxID=129052 RepID=UPI0003604007|nr:efflux RND transporter periplasmic adaptor subunit [Catelliglobosispora koreensis]